MRLLGVYLERLVHHYNSFVQFLLWAVSKTRPTRRLGTAYHIGDNSRQQKVLLMFMRALLH